MSVNLCDLTNRLLKICSTQCTCCCRLLVQHSGHCQQSLRGEVISVGWSPDPRLGFPPLLTIATAVPPILTQAVD